MICLNHTHITSTWNSPNHSLTSFRNLIDLVILPWTLPKLASLSTGFPPSATPAAVLLRQQVALLTFRIRSAPAQRMGRVLRQTPSFSPTSQAPEALAFTSPSYAPIHFECRCIMPCPQYGTCWAA